MVAELVVTPSMTPTQLIVPAAAAVTQHMPALRHQLIMMLSGQSIDTLQSTEARETLRTDALAAVQQIIQDEAGVAGVTDLLFTSFIVQR